MSEPNDQPEEELTEETEDQSSESMPFLRHLEELRIRLIKSTLAVILCAVVAFVFSEQIVAFIKLPLKGVGPEESQLHNLQVTGALYAYLKVSLLTGVVVALPIIFYQAWRFIAPGLFSREKAMIVPMVLVSTILFLIGGAFCFLVVLPIGLQFLIGFAGEQIENMITINSYISFAGLLLLAFGFSFQMPILAYYLGKFGIISSGFLAKGRRYAAVSILVIGAVLTPPDVFTQLLLAGPMYLLYEISIVIVKLTGKRK